MDCYQQLGLLATGVDPALGHCASWSDVMKVLLATDIGQFDTAVARKLRDAADAAAAYSSLLWLGAFSALEPIQPTRPVLDSFCDLLQKRLAYDDGERDMVVMMHELVYETPDGHCEKQTSTIVAFGDAHWNRQSQSGTRPYSAMAKTVGLPLAYASDLLLAGRIAARGCILPCSQDIYEPILAQLQQSGIQIQEHTIRQ